MSRHGILAFLLVSLLPTLARPASAQSAPYVAVTGVAEIKQFGSSTSTYVFSQADGYSLDGTGAGGGLRVGTYLHPRWSLELSVDAGSRTQVEVENPITILIFPPPPRTAMRASTSYLTVSTLVGFHPTQIGRMRLGYRAGFSFVRGTYKSDYPSFILPAAISSGSVASSTLTPTSDLRPTIFPPPRITNITATRKHNAGALTLGFDAAIDMTRRLALVPEIRALVFSGPSNGPGVFLIRPGVGVRWTF